MKILKTTLILMLSLMVFSCDDSSSNAAPVITSGSGVHEAYVGMEFSVQIVASDPDTQNLTFRFVADDIDNATTRTHPPVISPGGHQSAYFIWTPIATDVGEHNVDIIVSDGKTEVTAVLTINVNSSTGTNPFPVFIEPLGSGTTLDLSKQSCIDVEIMVEDSDSQNVDIFLEDPVYEGYELTQDSPQDFEAIFSWCPTEKQISESDRYTLNLVANDREDHVTHKRYVIILRRDLETNCDGLAPVITHQSTPSIETLDNITVSFSVSDDHGISAPPVLYYTFTQPADSANHNLTDFIPVTASQLSGDASSGTYEVVIPNPVLNLNPGDSSSIYYFIEAEDNDDVNGSCDHRTDAPEGDLFTTVVTYPQGTIEGLPMCSECQSDIQCGSANDLCIVLLNGSSYCLKDCQDDPDNSCDTDSSCSVDPLTGTEGTMRRQCVPNTGNCNSTTNCVDDSYEENDTMSPSLPATGNLTDTGLKMCFDSSINDSDDDWFRIPLANTTLSLFEIAFQHGTGDLDMELFDSTGNSVAYSISSTNDESILECLPAGEYYLDIFSWEFDINQSYDINIELVENGCCSDDILEPNNDFGSADPVINGDIVDEVTICSGDEDWYQIDLNAGDTLNVTLIFDQTTSNQDLDVYLYDTDGTTNLTPCCDPGNGQSSTSDEDLTFSATATGTYFIKVEGYDGSENEYLIGFDIT